MSTPRSEHMPIGFSPSSGSDSPVGGVSSADSTAASAQSVRSAFALPGSLNSLNKMPGAPRSSGSPLHDMTPSRMYNKRARELQAQEGVQGLPLSLWGGPPTSGNSTPLRENIPESPTDGFPDLAPLPTQSNQLPQTRRARAGTVPSRFPPQGINGNNLMDASALSALSNKLTNKPTPPLSSFKTASNPLDSNDAAPGTSTLLSRLRAGSMPQRSPFMPGSASPFGPSIFNTGWNTGRDRGMTLQSIASQPSNAPSSPAQSAFSKEGAGDSDVHMRTLDYLGLAETPQQPRAQLATPYLANMNDYSRASRFRSYSVNNKDVYAGEDDMDYDEAAQYEALDYAQQLQNQVAAAQAAVMNHNMAVHAFKTRARARTVTGAFEHGLMQMGSGVVGIPSSLAQAEGHMPDDGNLDDLGQNIAAMSLARSNSRNNNNNGLLNPDDVGLEGPTSALWLGNIPTSTTTSTLMEMFKLFGPIGSVRVLTHKNCGFVNFDRVDSAVAARASLNNKEIFPGAGPVRINFAKPASASNTPGHDGAFPSPSPDPLAKGKETAALGDAATSGTPTAGTPADQTPSLTQVSNAPPTLRPVQEMRDQILDIVSQFGATDEERERIAASVDSAVGFTAFVDEIPAIREPAHTRVHDAPKLRDIRKRIDNQSLTQVEIEAIALEMLPEIAELSSDYLGNTVVQKLFEHCSDSHRDAMLEKIAPHMAEIGVHKNGTWAAQKIIDVCNTPKQMQLIVEHLRPYTIQLFLDQYGNYVLQGCLKFGAPHNDFIFETMLSRMWEVSQGRYGSRAMRACLESHHATKGQQRMLAAAIALHSVQLATNANGALLLTWFLDTCTLPQRRTVLTPQLVPYLVHLCTHKVAYLTVHKIINQKNEAEARDAMLKALFFTPNHDVLRAILSDSACGAGMIYKVITTPVPDAAMHGKIVEAVKSVLLAINAQAGQGYKRLMDEVGLSTRNNGGNRDHGGGGNGNSHNHNGGNNNSGEPRQRPASRQNNHHHNGQQQQQQQQQQGHGNRQQFYNGPMNPTANGPNFDAGYNVPRNDGMDPNMAQFPPFAGPQNPMYSSASTPTMPAAATMQQYQYQPAMMNRGLPANNFYVQMPYAGFSSNVPMEPFRPPTMANGSPIQAPASQMPPQMPPQMPGGPGFAPPGFNMGMGMPGFPYGGNMPNMAGNMPGAPTGGYQQPPPEQGGRRGRR